MSPAEEHERVMAELDVNARRIVEQAARLAVLEAEVEIYLPPVIDDTEEDSSQL